MYFDFLARIELWYTKKRIRGDFVLELFGKKYEVVEDFREGFQQEEVEGRFSEILNKYDFIVGDWGYGQLRLKGFYDDQNSKATFDTKISTLEDYLYEYCNFGCPYFVLKRVNQ
ncbi:YutD family protein [Halobacillus sp. KCTC 3957]|uniref:YutD family protein n=1 Tax=Halobacillus yeomjeoni TaxID=311194 RepID=A0A931HX20_9BACI|nr:YutD family protein [Halobacillus yeomjeoni]